MTQTPVPTTSSPGSATAPGFPAAPISKPRRGIWRRIYRICSRIYQFFSQSVAANWFQACVIVALFGAAIFVMLNERYLWGTLLAVAGGAFGLSFVLRRMVGDEYGRS